MLAGLNPEEGVAVYIDILMFSCTLEEHLKHWQAVNEQLEEAHLKLKPEVLKVNTRLVKVITNFPPPQSVSEVCRFLGLALYYWQFVPRFSKIAQPLHALTCKGATFMWGREAQAAMDLLKEKLTTVPVLGIGAVLSQEMGDHKWHPIAYASRSLTSAECHYSITELETLAVIWAVTHFHSYFYGHSVTILTDHNWRPQTPRGSMASGGPKCMVLESRTFTWCTVREPQGCS